MVRDFAIRFPVVLATFLILDSAWLGWVAPRFYQAQIGFLLRDTPNWYAAGLFYLLFIAGLTVFVVMPAVSQNAIWTGVARGAFFGLVTYATYDLTNHATLRGWPLVVTVVDLVWGTFICAVTTLVSTWLCMLGTRGH